MPADSLILPAETAAGRPASSPVCPERIIMTRTKSFSDRLAAWLPRLVMAILLNQNIRAEGALRAIYLHPMALSFIVTGIAWKWILNPDLSLQKVVNDLGW